MTQEEIIKKDLIEKIYKKLVHEMIGPNGEMWGANDCDGLIHAYRIVESFDPNPSTKIDDLLAKAKT